VSRTLTDRGEANGKSASAGNNDQGGVSLGAYEAGALNQTLALIGRNNAIEGSTKWYVDVITASAGSMTAVSSAVALIAGPNGPKPRC
jgi:hypothetical protein